MRSNLLLVLLGVAACLGMTGCYTEASARVEATGGEHTIVSNYGWSLFNCIPLACGNAAEDASMEWAFFRDDVTVEKLQRRFDALAAGRTILCPHCHYYDTVIMRVLGIPIPYVICYKEISISGTFK